MTTATVISSRNGSIVTATLGNVIKFNADVEQSALVKEIRHSEWDSCTIQVRVDVKRGCYAGNNQWLDLAQCWN